MERKYLWTYILIASVTLVTLIAVGDGRLRGESVNVDTELASGEPSRSFSFQLEIAGEDVGIYDECRGLGSSNDVEEAVVETPDGVVVRQKTPGVLEWHNITLKRTEPSGVVIWSWRKAMEDGDLDGAIRDGAITLWEIGPSSAEPLVRWEFRNGWVAALSFDGSIEQMTIVHEGLERTDVVDPGPKDIHVRP